MSAFQTKSLKQLTSDCICRHLEIFPPKLLSELPNTLKTTLLEQVIRQKMYAELLLDRRYCMCQCPYCRNVDKASVARQLKAHMCALFNPNVINLTWTLEDLSDLEHLRTCTRLRSLQLFLCKGADKHFSVGLDKKAIDKPALGSDDKLIVAREGKIKAVDKPALMSDDKPAVMSDDKPAVTLDNIPSVKTGDSFTHVLGVDADSISGLSSDDKPELTSDHSTRVFDVDAASVFKPSSDDSFTRLFQVLPSLTEFKIHLVDHQTATLITDSTIVSLCRFCPQLFSLGLSGCECLTNTCIKDILCLRIRYLDLSNTRLSDAAFTSVPQDSPLCSSLSELKLYDCIFISNAIVDGFLVHCGELSLVNCLGCPRLDNFDALFARNPKIQIHFTFGF